MSLSLEDCKALKEAGYRNSEYWGNLGIGSVLVSVDGIVEQLTPQEIEEWTPIYAEIQENPADDWRWVWISEETGIEASTLLEYWARVYIKLRGKK